MKLDEQILNLVRYKFGTPLARPSELDALAEHISIVTGERLGVNTLNRLFGLIDGGMPTQTAFNIVAQYLGYGTFSLLSKCLRAANSDFAVSPDEFYPQDLPVEAAIELTYESQRRLRLIVGSDHRLRVVLNESSKLAVSNLLTVASIKLHAPFF